METVSLGIDVGKGFVKVCDGTSVYRYPSYFSITDSYSVAESNRVNAISMGGKTYLCVNNGSGPPVGDIVQTRDGKKTEGEGTLLHVCNVVAGTYEKLHGAGKNHVELQARVSVGLPVSGYDVEKEKLKNILGGERFFVRNGRSFKVTIEPHTCREGLGAYLGMLLHNDGQVKDHDLFNSLIAVVDIGHRTTDVFLVKSGRAEPKGCKSFMMGIFDVQAKVEEWVSSTKGPLVDADEIRIFDWLAGGPLPKINRQVMEAKDMEPYRKDALEGFFALLQERVIRFVGGLGIDELLLTGGGAELLRPLVESADSSIRICDQPQFSNVIGFYKSLSLLKN